MFEFIAFLACLEFAVLNSAYHNNILKPKQVLRLESIYLRKYVICILPTGYGKSLIFHLTPLLMFARDHMIFVHGNQLGYLLRSFVHYYGCFFLEFSDTRSNISTEFKWPSRVCHFYIPTEIFYGEITDDAVNLDGTPYDYDPRLCEKDRLLSVNFA